MPAGKSIVTITATSAELGVPRERSVQGGTAPAFQAFRILHWGFVAAPILMGADKFFDLLCNWEQYLAPSLLNFSPLSAAATMRAVGVVEIAAGLVVALKPRIGAWVEEAQSAGAKLLAGATDVDPLRPIVLGDAPETAHVVCDEVFGPVCVVNPVDSLDDAFARANGTDYGLQAGIFTGSITTALAAAEALEFGGVTVNEAPTFRADQMPYGGVKGSGNTKEGPAYTIREMTEERLVVLQA